MVGILLTLSSTALAQLQRYYVRPRQGAVTTHQDLVFAVNAAVVGEPEPRAGIVADLDYPQFGVSAVAANLTPVQADQLNQGIYSVRPDVTLQPAGTPAGTGWARNQFCLPTVVDPCENTPPVVYVIDTGIDPTHPDFAYPVTNQTLTFLPGLSYGFDVTPFPPVPLPPYVDPYDHGTRVTGCMGGILTGLLGPIGGRAQVKSVIIYDSPPGGGPQLSTFVSQAINGILGAVSDHQSRRSQAYLKNHASVLVFAHSTTVATGRFGDLDRAIEIAWEEGMHVVMSAGNEGAAAVLVSPAGAAWGYVATTPTRFWFGAPPPGAIFYRAAQEFLVVGGFQQAAGGGGNLLWPGSNIKIPGAEAIDGFSPALNVPCTSLMPPGSYAVGTGTSYSTGLTAALVTWAAYSRPWASPTQVRQWMRSSTTLQPGGWQKYETPALAPAKMTYAEWIEHYYPTATSLPSQRDPMGDPDADQMLNFVEYYCGLDPRFEDAGGCLHVEVDPQQSEVLCEVRLPKACYLGSSPEVIWRLECSTDCQSWLPVTPNSFAAVSPVQVMGDGEMWEALAVTAPMGVREYFRLKFSATVPLL